MSGTASATFEFVLISRLSNTFHLPTGDYYLSGAIGGSAALNLPINRNISGSGVRYGEDTGNGLDFTVTDSTASTGVWIAINSGTPTNTTFKPMIITKANKDNGNTDYQPPAMSNVELTAKEQQNENNISAVQTDTALLKNTITTIRFASGTSRTFQFTQRTNYHIFMVFGFVQGVGLVYWTCKIDNTGTLKVYDTLTNTEVTQSTITYSVSNSIGTVTIQSSVAQWSYLTIIKNAEIT